jgi:hypothetical protein
MYQKYCHFYRDSCLYTDGIGEHPVNNQPWRLQAQNTLMVNLFLSQTQ